MSLMTPESIADLVRVAGRRWDTSIAHWQERDQIELLCESQYVLCRAACAWAGVSLPGFEVSARTRDLAAMVDAFGGVGWRNWRGRWARARSELWIRSMIERVRGRTFTAPADSALALWTWHRGQDGNLLPSRVAAVELLNVLRPIVAVANFIAFAAAALIKYPEYRLRLKVGEKGLDECFVHEVRRYYPFAPFIGARTRIAFRKRHGISAAEGSARHSRHLRHQSRRTPVAGPRHVLSGALQQARHRCFRLPAARRWRPIDRTSLCRRMDHHRAHASGRAHAGRVHHLRCADAGHVVPLYRACRRIRAAASVSATSASIAVSPTSRRRFRQPPNAPPKCAG